MSLDLYNYRTEKPFTQKNLVTLQDYSRDEIYLLLSTALDLKKKQKAGIPHPYLSGKALGMIFTKASTRTRVSFEVGIHQLGGYALYLNAGDIQLGRGETISDTARVLSRYLDGIMIRTFKQQDVEELAKHSSIPVINGLTDLLHPCQVLDDLMTIYENKGALSGLKLAFIGDGNNMSHSLLIGCTKVGIHISVACPEGYMPNQKIVEMARENGKETGANVIITHDPVEAVCNADVVYTDVWASMGQEKDFKNRVEHFMPYQVNNKLFSYAKHDAIFMHCLPAHRSEEVTADVIDGPHSVVFDEAENRLHMHKAIMVLLMGDRKE